MIDCGFILEFIRIARHGQSKPTDGRSNIANLLNSSLIRDF